MQSSQHMTPWLALLTLQCDISVHGWQAVLGLHSLLTGSLVRAAHQRVDKDRAPEAKPCMLISSILREVLIATLVRLRVCVSFLQNGFKISDCCLELVPHLHEMTKGFPHVNH